MDDSSLNNHKQRSGDLKHTTTIEAADLVLPQPVPLCLKFFLNGEKREFSVYGVLGPLPLI